MSGAITAAAALAAGLEWWDGIGDRVVTRLNTGLLGLIVVCVLLQATAIVALLRRARKVSGDVNCVVSARSGGLRAFVSDVFVLTRRNLLLTWRTPQLIVAAAIMPIMFVLLFWSVFGGSIRVAGYPNYIDYLIPGIIVQTILFGGSSSAVSVAEDLTRGVSDRFRSLPTHRSAILAARTLADLLRLTLTVSIMIVVGLLAGFRFHNGLLPSLCGIGVALLFGYASSWCFTLVGLVVRSVEAATLSAFVLTMPLVFAASTFTSTASMPGWLSAFAGTQPVTQVIDALRALTQGTGSAEPAALEALAWSAVILGVSVILALRRFRST